MAFLHCPLIQAVSWPVPPALKTPSTAEREITNDREGERERTNSKNGDVMSQCPGSDSGNRGGSSTV